MTSTRTGTLRIWIAGSRLLTAAAVTAALACAPRSTQADAIVEPAVFTSSHSVLDILMVAKPLQVASISFEPPGGGAPIHPTGWVYEICPRPPSSNECPAGPPTVSDYGGVRLALRAGEALKIRLVNRLPKLDPAKLKHVSEPGQDNLFRNPTNLHTHGLIVPARTPTLSDPTFGDYVFLQVYNSANGMPPPPRTTHQDGPIETDFVDYRIDIPANHPSGLFWFHPHVHGISLNQVSSGLAGIISIGDVRDYVGNAPAKVRHLILKDMQVLAAGKVQYVIDRPPVTVVDGEVQNQQDGDFCEQHDSGGPDSRQGFCEGQPAEHGGSNNFINSRWYFTINGQVFPTVRQISADGEIWRLTNASAQFSYQLNLVDDVTHTPMLLQLIAIDGVSIIVPAGTPARTVMTMGANKFTVADCPSGGTNMLPVCVRDLVMMPSARAEVWVTYRDASGAVVAPPPGATATLQQGTVNLGPAGESWPQLKLAKVEFAQPGAATTAVAVAGNPIGSLVPTAMVAAAIAHPAAMPTATACQPLADHHRRRIFFGMENPSDPESRFGLGYEEVDQNGAPVSGTQVPVSAFNPTRNVICVPLGPGGTEVHETWELVNLATETHNFHIHQTKFQVLDAATLLQAPQSIPGTAVIKEDNVPLPFADATSLPEVEKGQHGYCTIEQWRDQPPVGVGASQPAGKCISQPIVVDIPFSQLGEFVYHCHILEHEDGGMMAKIEVVLPTH